MLRFLGLSLLVFVVICLINLAMIGCAEKPKYDQDYYLKALGIEVDKEKCE